MRVHASSFDMHAATCSKILSTSRSMLWVPMLTRNVKYSSEPHRHCKIFWTNSNTVDNKVKNIFKQANKAAWCVMSSENKCYTQPLLSQKRFEYGAATGKRSHEAFLSQFDPMDMLELESDCTIEEIEEAFEKMKAKYGPNGPCKNPKLLDRVFKAYEILKDPQSPYYLRAHVSQTDRQRLQFNLLPKKQRVFITIQGLFLAGIGLTAFVLIIVLSFLPARRALRAATR